MDEDVSITFSYCCTSISVVVILDPLMYVALLVHWVFLNLGRVARQRPKPTLRQGCTCLGANWRPWRLKLKLSLSRKRWVSGQKSSPNLGRQCIWSELHETGGLSATVAVNRLGRCRANRHRSAESEMTKTRNKRRKKGIINN